MSTNESPRDPSERPYGPRAYSEFRQVVRTIEYQIEEMVKPAALDTYPAIPVKSIRRLMIALEASLHLPHTVPLLLTSDLSGDARTVLNRAALLNEVDFMGLNSEFYNSYEWNPAVLWEKFEDASQVRGLYLLLDRFERMADVEPVLLQLLFDLKERQVRNGTPLRAQKCVHIIAATHLSLDELREHFTGEFLALFYPIPFRASSKFQGP